MAAEEQIQWLKSQLREREEQVHQAAQAGLDLLNQQMELQNRLDEQRVEMTNALEVWRCTLEGQLTQVTEKHTFSLTMASGVYLCSAFSFMCPGFDIWKFYHSVSTAFREPISTVQNMKGGLYAYIYF